MAHREDVVKYMNEYLGLYAYKDYGPMGLQFIGNEQIKKIACAVSVSVETITKAAMMGADILIVHHGLFWNNEPRRIDPRMSWRMGSLEDYQLNLCGYHLCLDAHPEIGNNILAAEAIGITDLEPFADIGWGGNVVDPSTFFTTVTEAYFTDNNPIRMFIYNDRLERACVVTGKGGNLIYDAYEQGYDVLVTGEAEEPSIHLAKDLKMGLIAAGHNATEEIGVKALAKLTAEHFDLPWEFIPIDNPV